MKKYVEQIINSNDNQKMHKLHKVVDKMIDYIYDMDKDEYDELDCELYEIVNGKVLNEEMCRKWVAEMQPPAKWSMEDIVNMSRRFSNSIPTHELYAIMNMLYSHYSNEVGTDDSEDTLRRYVAMAQKWYFDEDAGKRGSEKLYCYYMSIVKG